MKTYVFVQADTNDADYVSQLKLVKGWDYPESKWTEEDLVNLVKKVAKALSDIKIKKKADWYHNWDTSEYGDERFEPKVLYADSLTEEEVGMFDEIFVPVWSQGVHTITEIKILKVSEEEEVFNKYE
jgi:hypothetical protein